MIGINELEVVYEFEPEKNITLKSLNRLLNHWFNPQKHLTYASAPGPLDQILCVAGGTTCRGSVTSWSRPS